MSRCPDCKKEHDECECYVSLEAILREMDQLGETTPANAASGQWYVDDRKLFFAKPIMIGQEWHLLEIFIDGRSDDAPFLTMRLNEKTVVQEDARPGREDRPKAAAMKTKELRNIAQSFIR